MTMQSKTSPGPSFATAVFTATGVTWVFLLLQWFVVSGFGYEVSQEATARTLLAVAGAGLVIGLIAGAVSVLPGKWQVPPLAAVVMPLSMLSFLEMYSALGEYPAVKLGASAGFGVLVFIIVAILVKKAPRFIQSAKFWWLAAGLMFEIALLLSVVNAVDMSGVLIATVTAFFSVALLFKGWNANSEGIAFAALAMIVVLVASAILGNRVPVYEPDTVASAADRPSILLVSIDTLRADHVGAYGYKDARTPILDGLASEGILFRQTVSANIYTGPSHASILTGLLPEKHGVLVNRMRLPDGVPTLADILRQNGYVTGAFVSGYTTQDSACGLPSRFNAFDDDIRAFRWLPVQAGKIAILDMVLKLMKTLGLDNGASGQAYRMGSDTADEAIEWLDSNGGRPFFMWAHFFDPHIPYRPPQKYLQEGGRGESGVSGNWYSLNARQRAEIVDSAEKTADMIGLYDGEIAYADAQLGRIVAAARRAAPGQKLLVVATSDHGESMGEHGIFWFRHLYDPTLLVPLIIVPADPLTGAVHEVKVQVRLIDLAPTILELVNIESAEQFDGTSLVNLVRGTDADSPGPAFSGSYPTSEEFAQERHSVRHDGWKLIRNARGWNGGGAGPVIEESRELYDIGEDPDEKNNLAGSGGSILDTLGKTLDAHQSPSQKPELHLTPEERERLRSLGYVH